MLYFELVFSIWLMKNNKRNSCYLTADGKMFPFNLSKWTINVFQRRKNILNFLINVYLAAYRADLEQGCVLDRPRLPLSFAHSPRANRDCMPALHETNRTRLKLNCICTIKLNTGVRKGWLKRLDAVNNRMEKQNRLLQPSVVLLDEIL